MQTKIALFLRFCVMLGAGRSMAGMDFVVYGK